MDSFNESGALIMNKSKLILICLFFLLLIMILPFSNKAAQNIFLVKDFCNWSNSFLPAVQFYTSDYKLNSNFSAELIYNKNTISPYQQDSIFKDLAIYKSGNKFIGLTDLSYPPLKIGPKDEIEFTKNTIYCFLIENGIFINPIEFLKPVISTSVSIVNVYYLNEEDVAVAFRANYKNNIIPILIYAYSTYLSGRFAFTSNVYKIEIFLDDEIIYERKLDIVSKKKIVELLLTSSRPQFIKYIISNVADGEHILRVRVYDFNNNFKEIQKKFTVKSY